MQPPIFAAVRVERINNVAALKHAEAHGLRNDAASAKRVVDTSKTAQNLASSAYSPGDPLALVEAFKNFKAKTGAVEGQAKAAIGLHVLCILSPEMIAEAGDVHDPANPANQCMFEAARDWGVQTFGEGSLIAARMDMDEAGSGVVDLFVCPTAMQSGGRRKKEKLTISVNSALKRVQGQHGVKRSFGALQTSWAAYAAARLDPRIQRGRPKRETGRHHVHADVYREVAERIKADRAELHARRAAIAEMETQARARAEAATAERQTALDQREARLKKREAEIDDLEQRKKDLEASVMKLREAITAQTQEIDEIKVRRKALEYAAVDMITIGNAILHDWIHSINAYRHEIRFSKTATLDIRNEVIGATHRQGEWIFHVASKMLAVWNDAKDGISKMLRGVEADRAAAIEQRRIDEARSEIAAGWRPNGPSF